MIDLRKSSGLQLIYDEKEKELFFNSKKLKPDIRYAKDMKDVLYQKEKLKKKDQNNALYFMFRDVARTNAFLKKSLRYDVTVIMPGKIGKEYIKTAGHYHPEEAHHVSFPEVYEVLHGEAHIIIEKINAKNEVTDAYLIVAESGDKILVPPNYGHITINTTDSPLIMANIVEAKFSSDYKPIKQRHGAAYFLVDDKGPAVIKNKHYKDIPALKEIMPKQDKKLCLEKNIPLFSAAKSNPAKFMYLVQPHKYLAAFKRYFA